MSTATILLVPDLHLSKDMGTQWNTIQKNITTRLGLYQNVDLIVSTGDVTDKGHREGLQEGFDFLIMLRTMLGGPPLVITPGNHDVKRTNDIEDLKNWENFDHYLPFAQEFKRIFDSQPDKNVLKPLLMKDDLDQEDVRNAIDEIIKKEFERKHLSKSAINNLPFVWLREKHLFCYALSSVDLSGSPFIPPGENLAMALDTYAKLKPNNKKNLLNRIYQHDIPYVGTHQLGTLEIICERLESDAKTQDAFSKSIKIAVLHHPLILLPEEPEIREFDNVANGPFVVNRLRRLGFTLVLYGHKHHNNMSINFGLCSSKSSHCELAAVAGGKITSIEKKPDPVFQVVHIEDEETNNNFARIVKVEYIYTEREKPKNPTYRNLFSVEHAGRARWLYCDSERYLARNHLLNKKFVKFVRKIETEFFSLNPPLWTTDYDNADESIINFFELMEGYAEGEFGITDGFIEELKDDLKEANTMYFIDILGSSAWAHPNFMRHLALQLWYYSLRNHVQISSGSWSHRDPVEKALQKLKIHESKKLAEEIDNGEFKRSEDTRLLDLDICRILIWEKEKLNSIPGRNLIQLHKIFQIPLFFLEKCHYNKEKYPEAIEKDFHLIKYHEKNPKGLWYYDRQQGRKHMQQTSVENCWNTLKFLLKHDNLQGAKSVLEDIIQERKIK